MKIDDLARCPFCGGDAGFDHDCVENNGEPAFWAYCNKCSARSGDAESMEAAEADWNRVADLERQLAESQARKAQIRQAVGEGEDALDRLETMYDLDRSYNVGALRQALEVIRARSK